MRIRGFHPDDTAIIVELFRDTVHQVNSRDYTREQVEAWAPQEIDQERWLARLANSFTLVAVDGGQIIGFANLESDGHLDCIYAHAQHQGRGVGTALLTAIEVRARELGLTRLFAEVSITARPFFEHRGFVVVEERRVHCREVWFINYRMEKRL
jgi:N-acetylglutamate synthase-like GNAT family acetyltransferase